MIDIIPFAQYRKVRAFVFFIISSELIYTSMKRIYKTYNYKFASIGENVNDAEKIWHGYRRLIEVNDYDRPDMGFEIFRMGVLFSVLSIFYYLYIGKQFRRLVIR